MREGGQLCSYFRTSIVSDRCRCHELNRPLLKELRKQLTTCREWQRRLFLLPRFSLFRGALLASGRPELTFSFLGAALTRSLAVVCVRLRLRSQLFKNSVRCSAQ